MIKIEKTEKGTQLDVAGDRNKLIIELGCIIGTFYGQGVLSAKNLRDLVDTAISEEVQTLLKED